MLAETKKVATEAGFEVEWIHADATPFKSDRLFDTAICLCEGAFGLLDMDGDPFEQNLALCRELSSL